MSRNNEYYFRLSLTENEQDCIELFLKQFCFKHNLELKYYRKIKTGHIPMIREIKVVGSNAQRVDLFIRGHELQKYIVVDY
jgi:hypothetical protein